MSSTTITEVAVPVQTYVYDDFIVTFKRARPDCFHVVARDDSGGVAESEFTLPVSTQQLERVVVGFGRSSGRSAGPAPDSVETAGAQELGAALATALFDPTIGALYDNAVKRASETADRGVRLTLSLGATPELLSVPWELLYRGRMFLASQRHYPVVRHLDTGSLASPQRVEGAVRVLGVVASPTDLPQLDVAEERRRVEEALAPMIERGLVTLDWCDPATPRRLRQSLRDGSYHVLHYIGHSDFSDDGEGVLYLQDHMGASMPVTEAVLTNLLGDQTTLRLAVLNSCEGARTTVDDPFSGIATSLVGLGVPAVVAMQFTISDRAAIVFAEELFTSLIGRQYPIDAAVSEARKAVFTEVNEIEWATPVLFLRAENGQLFHFVEAPVIAPALPSTPRPSRRRGLIVGIGIGVAAAMVVGAVGITQGWFADDPQESTATCYGQRVPTSSWTGSAPTEEDAADVLLVQRYFSAIASAKHGVDNTAVHDEMVELFPTTPISEAQLDAGYDDMEAARTRWIASDTDGNPIVGELVYDNRVDNVICRTGFLCWAAVVEDGIIEELRYGSASKDAYPYDGSDDRFSYRYPYMNSRWFAPREQTGEGTTAEELLVDVCRGANYSGGSDVAGVANLPPAIPDESAADDASRSVWPYGAFRNVPVLGEEPSRGSGCGGQGQIGGAIPDGLWAGFVDRFDDAALTMAIDLLCIYSGREAESVLEDGWANILVDDPDYLVVNNSKRLRTMPASDLRAVIEGVPDGSSCVEGDHGSPDTIADAIEANRGHQAWVRVSGGEVTWVFFDCVPLMD